MMEWGGWGVSRDVYPPNCRECVALLPDAYGFLKPASRITDSGDFVVKRDPRGALKSGQMLRKWGKLRQIFGLGCPESSKNGVRTEAAIGGF